MFIYIVHPCFFSYKDIKEEKSQAFGFGKIKNALPSFESYLEDEFAEYVKAYALLDERAQNLISTKPSLSAVCKNPAILSNYQNGIAKWQRDASNLSVTGGGFIRKLPIRNCVLPLQQKLRSLILKQLLSFHEIRKNNIGLEITSAAWNFRGSLERVTAMQLFDKFGTTYSLPSPAPSDSAQEIYSGIKKAALAKISQATLQARKKLFDLIVSLIPAAVAASEEFNKRKLLQDAIHQKVDKYMSQDMGSALISICEPWDALVQGFCSLHSFADAIKQCTSIDVTVLLNINDDEDERAKVAKSVTEEVTVTMLIGDLSYEFPAVSAQIRKIHDSDEPSDMAAVAGNAKATTLADVVTKAESTPSIMTLVAGKATTMANILSDGFFAEKAIRTCSERIKKETNKVMQQMRNIPGIDVSKLPEILKVVSAIHADNLQALKSFSDKIRTLMANVAPVLSSVHQEMATKLDDIRVIAQKDQLWHIYSSQFFMMQQAIRQANSSLMRELQFDYEPLQALIEIYNDQFMCSPQHQISISFGSSDDVVAAIHRVASSPWFTSVDTRDDKEGLTSFFIQHLKLKYDDMQKSVKRLEVVCRRVKDSANDYAKSPTKKRILSKLRARVFKSVLVENSLKLSFAPYGYSFCKLMTEKGAWERAETDAAFKSELRDVLQRLINLDFQLTFMIRADFSNPLKIISQSPEAASSPLTPEALALVTFSIDPPKVPFLEDVDAVIDGKGDLNKFYGGRFGGKQPLSVFSIKTSLYNFLVSWHAFFRPGKRPSKDHLEFRAPVIIKKMLSSSEKTISFRVDNQDVYLVFRDSDGKSEQLVYVVFIFCIYAPCNIIFRHLNTIIVCRTAPQASAPNKLVMFEYNNDTVLSFSSAEAASAAMNAILECQLLSLSSSAENLSTPRWQSEYAIKSFMLQVRCCFWWAACFFYFD